MEKRDYLVLSRFLSFIVFLFSFGKLWFEWGSTPYHDGFFFLFLFPIVHLFFLFYSHVLVCIEDLTNKHYLFIGIYNFLFFLLVIIVSSIFVSTIGLSRADMIYDYPVAALSLVISIFYFLIVFKFKNE